MMVGNGATNWKFDVEPSFPATVRNFNIIPPKLFNDFESNNCHYYFYPEYSTERQTPKCDIIWEKINTLAADLNWYDLYRKVYPDSLLASSKAALKANRVGTSMIDGNLTAIKEISDLRVGDVVEFAVTIERQPLLAGASAEDWLALPPGGTIDHVRYRAVWPRAMAIRWNATRGIDGAHLFEKGNQNELVYEATGLKIPEPPTDAPQRYNNLGEIELTAYKSWADISRLFAPLYASMPDDQKKLADNVFAHRSSHEKK